MARGKSKRRGRTLPRSALLTPPSPLPVGPATETPLGEVVLKEGQTATPVGDLEDPTTLIVPTIALRSITAVARADGVERMLSEEIEKKLSPQGKHMLTGMNRVFNTDGTDFIRARAMLQLRDRQVGHAYEVFLDFPTRYIGMLLDAVKKEDEPVEPTVEFRWEVPKPTWAGSYSFDKVWRQCSLLAQTSYQNRKRNGVPGGDQLKPRGFMAMSTLHHLKDAHLVRVEPEQVQVLPEWDELENLWDYAQDVVLPFDSIYLDFEGPGGFPPVHSLEDSLRWKGDDTKTEIELRGALVWRDSDKKLVVTAFGWPTKWPGIKSDPRDPTWSPYEPVGQVVFGTGSVYEAVMDEIGEVTMRLGDSGVYSKPLGLPTATLTGKPQLPGFVQVPIDMDSLDAQWAKTEGMKEQVENDKEKTLQTVLAGWGSIALSAAARSLAALSILEADEVELVDAPVEKRVKDRAAKRGWNLAQIVWIRPPKKYMQQNQPSGEEAHYSHRFWVRAHTNHYPIGTRIADARPDLIKGCHRCGTCRRVPVKAFIKGPHDRPLVPKSLAIKKRPVPVQLPQRDVAEPAYYKAPGAA